MSPLEPGPWLLLLALGAVHGLNPGMGWLFAVALGLQERKALAVWRALPPLGLGHAFAIAIAVAAAAIVGRALPAGVLRWLVAACLVSFGIYRLVRHRHFNFGGMRIGPRDLTFWSFLMATGHGAGLMILPIILGTHATPAAAGHAAHAVLPTPLVAGVSSETISMLGVTAVHTAGYLLVAGFLAWLVYHKLGLRLLRTGWINIDLIWAVALIATGLATPFLG